MIDTEDKAGYYEAKGMVRQMVVLPESHRDRLKNAAKAHKLTIGEVIEVLLDTSDSAVIAQHLEAKRAIKIDGRVGKRPEKLSKTALFRDMKDPTPEQLAAIKKIMSAKQP